MLKAALHVHSDWSYDGKWSLEKISSVFARRGYQAVLLCEHCRTFDEPRWRKYQRACRSIRTGAALLPGIEYSDPSNTIHVPIWGLKLFIEAEPEVSQVIKTLQESSLHFSILAHPARRDAWRCVPQELIRVVDAVELWNRKADGFAPTRTASRFIQAGLPGVTALDFHTDKQRFPFSLVVDVDPTASELEIISALKSGDYRSTFLGLDCRRLCQLKLPQVLRAVEQGRRLLLGCKRSLSARRNWQP